MRSRVQAILGLPIKIGKLFCLKEEEEEEEELEERRRCFTIVVMMMTVLCYVWDGFDVWDKCLNRSKGSSYHAHRIAAIARELQVAVARPRDRPSNGRS